jgi:hypothetical protein
MDGDGFPNDAALKGGTSPGDAASNPSVTPAQPCRPSSGSGSHAAAEGDARRGPALRPRPWPLGRRHLVGLLARVA